MKTTFEHLDYENTFGLTLLRDITFDPLHKFHFIVNFWKFVFTIHFAKQHSKKEYLKHKDEIGYDKEIACRLWYDDEWHLTFDLWSIAIYFDRCGVMNWHMWAHRRKTKAR